MSEDIIKETMPSVPDPDPGQKQTRQNKILIGLAAGIILLCGLCVVTGVIDLNISSFGGAIWFEDLILTDALSESGEVLSPPQSTFKATDRINGLITTSGADGPVAMRWYYGQELLYEPVGRTVDNKFSTYIEGSPLSPLPSGEYRVEAFIGLGRNEPKKTVTFTVEEFNPVLKVVPPQPTPDGHEDIENAPYVEVPFAFDEIWTIDDQEWVINEVKITFFQDQILFVIVVESEISIEELTEDEAREISRPIAEYALENGYYEMAKEIEINGEKYDFAQFSEPIVVTLFNISVGGGYRTRFEFTDLSN